MTPISFSVIFNLLLKYCHKSDGKKYTLVELAETIDISRPQLTQYKMGNHNNPTLESIRSILDVFGMPITLLDCHDEAEAIQLIQDVQNGGVNPSLRFRNPDARGLSDEALTQVESIFEWIVKREKAIRDGDDIPDLPEFSADD
ncbi:MAG: helix-turn-helix transcriptional regulator [Phototrophicaceae bacterium]